MSDNTATFQIKDYVVFKRELEKVGFPIFIKHLIKKNQKNGCVKEICLDTLNKYKESIKRETK